MGVFSTMTTEDKIVEMMQRHQIFFPTTQRYIVLVNKQEQTLTKRMYTVQDIIDTYYSMHFNRWVITPLRNIMPDKDTAISAYNRAMGII